MRAYTYKLLGVGARVDVTNTLTMILGRRDLVSQL